MSKEPLKRMCINCHKQDALPFTKYCQTCVNRGLTEGEKLRNYLTPTTGVRTCYEY